jgi:hypothetical protein
MMGIFNLLKTNNIEVLKFSLEGLIEVVRLNYVYMGRYLEQILGSTYYLFNLYQTCQHEISWANKEQLREIAGFSIEIWNTLCEEEIATPNFSLIKTSQTQQGFVWQ